MRLFVLPMLTAVGCVFASWRSWAGMELAFRTSGRGAIVRLLLLLLTLITLALIVHVVYGFFIWSRFSEPEIRRMASGLLIASVLPVTTALLGRGWLRLLPPLGGLAAAFVWTMILAELAIARNLHGHIF